MDYSERKLHEPYPVTESAIDYVDGKLESYGDDSTHFFKHVLVSGALRLRDDRWVFVPRQLRQNKLTDANPDRLCQGGVLESEGEDRWRVPQELYHEFARSLTDPELLPRQYDLFTGQESETLYHSNKYDANRNAHPSLVQESMDALSRGYINLSNVSEYLASRRRKLKNRRRVLEEERAPLTGPRRERYRQSMDRYSRDLMYFTTVQHQFFLYFGNDVDTYLLGYKPEPSGRFRQIGGGFQKSMEMKKKGYAGVDGVHVYRIKASIPTMLRDFMAETGWDSRFLDTYLRASDAASTHAHNLGITESEWTSLLNAVCLGAFGRSPESGDLMRFPPLSSLYSRFRRILRTRHGKLTQGQIFDEYARFHRQVSDLLTQLGKWRTHMNTEWLPEHSYVGRGGYWLRNDVGCSMKVDTCRAKSKSSGGLLPFRIQRFLLHGREAHFIHTLTIEADKAGVEVISNEGDGIVTRGKVSESTLRKAKQKSPLDDVEIEETKLS